MSRRKCRRKAYSLLEIVIVVSLLGVILSLAATLLGASFRINTRALERADFTRSHARFSQQLRIDAHSAVSAELVDDEEPPTMRFQMPDGRTISYRASTEGIERSLADAGEVVHEDLFRLPDCQVNWSLSKLVAERNSELVTARLEITSKPPTALATDLLPVEAAIGLHRRAEDSEAKE